MSYTKLNCSTDNECHKGQYNDNADNREFVQLRDVLSAERYRDYVIADMCDIARSTFSKIKLGYYTPTPVQLTALRYAVKRCGLNSKPNIKDRELSVDSKCTRAGDAYVSSLVVQTDETKKPTVNSKKLSVNKALKTDSKTIVLNVPTNFSGTITINVN